MEELFNNIYILSFYGFILYTVGKFNVEKDEFDNENKKFNLTKYLFKNWDNWLFSFLIVPVLALKAKDIWAGSMDILGKDWDFYQVYYLGVGAIVEAIYTAFAWISDKRNKLKN